MALVRTFKFMQTFLVRIMFQNEHPNVSAKIPNEKTFPVPLNKTPIHLRDIKKRNESFSYTIFLHLDFDKWHLGEQSTIFFMGGMMWLAGEHMTRDENRLKIQNIGVCSRICWTWPIQLTVVRFFRMNTCPDVLNLMNDCVLCYINRLLLWFPFFRAQTDNFSFYVHTFVRRT